jgi:hypothetical protein
MGYFERSKRFNINTTEKIISFFYENFCTQSTKIVIATSYYIDDDNASKKYGKTVRDSEIYLDNNGYIKHINGNSYFSENNDIFDKQLLELNTLFDIYTEFDNEILRHLSLLGMTDSNVNGQCFFILEKEDLIIYPHGDNTGYGCIGINSKNSKKGHEFLYAASKKKYLNSYIYSEDKKSVCKII